VVGPEAPLIAGLADALAAEGLPVFGPGARGAMLEGSKVLAKRIMREHGIPTADFEVFGDAESALAYLRTRRAPIVVKAEGIAAGKGVFVAETIEEAERAVRRIMIDRAFGEAGARVVIEEFLDGEEASFLAVTDGKRILPLASSQDHKRLLDGDLGPNTGGMGAYSPAPVVTPEMEMKIMDRVVRRTVEALAVEGIAYRGVLYAGIMICDGEPKVLEFNARFGDPETQPLCKRMAGDLVPVLAAVAAGDLGDARFTWDPRPAVCVVMAAEGYPGTPVGRGSEGSRRLPAFPTSWCSTRAPSGPTGASWCGAGACWASPRAEPIWPRRRGGPTRRWTGSTGKARRSAATSPTARCVVDRPVVFDGLSAVPPRRIREELTRKPAPGARRRRERQ
jgi:phosphoribosylamine--glycine ligase